jgi:hypothetical protein
MACSVDAAQVLLDDPIHPQKCGYNARFDTLACSVSRSTPGVNSVAVNRVVGAVCVYERVLSAGYDQPAGP